MQNFLALLFVAILISLPILGEETQTQSSSVLGRLEKLENQILALQTQIKLLLEQNQELLKQNHELLKEFVYSPNILDGLLVYYKGEGNAYDFSGNDMHGILKNNVVFDKGMIGLAFRFNGVNNYIDTEKHISVENFTMAAWIWIDSNTNLGEKRILSADDTNAEHRHLFVLKSSIGAGGMPGLEIMQNGTLDAVTDTKKLSAGWNHIAGIRDGKNIKLYVNGIQVSEKVTKIEGNISPKANFVVGTVSPECQLEFFTGLMDEVVFYNRALSNLEIQYLAKKCIIRKIEKSRIITPLFYPHVWHEVNDVDGSIEKEWQGTQITIHNSLSPRASWIDKLKEHKGNQLRFPFAVGLNNFSLSFEIQWDSNIPQLTLAHVGLVKEDGTIIAMAGYQDGAATNFGKPIVKIIDSKKDHYYEGSAFEKGSTSYKIVRLDNE